MGAGKDTETTTAEALYLPSCLRGVSGAEVGRFYENYLREVESVPFEAAEREYLENPNVLGRVVEPGTRAFFGYHVGAAIARLVAALTERHQHGRLLDLGCGSGSVALLLALGGARVVGVDSNPVAFAACRKRQAHYESQVGPLALEFRHADALKVSYQEIGACDGIYSAFAINLMQPTAALLDRVVPTLTPGGRFVVAEGNPQSIVSRVLRPQHGPTPAVLQKALRAHGLRVLDVRFGGLIPASLAGFAPTRHVADGIERYLAPSGVLQWVGASYTLLAERAQVPRRRGRIPVEPRRTRTPGRVGRRVPWHPNGRTDSVERRERLRVTRRPENRTTNRRFRTFRRARTLGASGVFVAAVCALACVFADTCIIPICC